MAKKNNSKGVDINELSITLAVDGNAINKIRK